MWTLRWLISKEWLRAFIVSCLVLLLLVSIANIVSELMRAVTTVPDILLHHLLELPKWLNKIFPVAALTATLFSLNKLKQRSELIAIFACSFPRSSFLTLLFILASGVATLQFVNSAYLRPWTEKMKKEWLRDQGIHFRQEKEVGIKATNSITGKIWYRNTSYYSSFVAFDKYRNELRELTLFYYGQDYKLTQIVWVDRARYLRDNLWQLIDGKEITSLQNREFPKVSLFKEKKLNLLERPADFKDIDSELNELNWPNLYAYVLKIKRLGISTHEYEVILYDKVSSSLICLIFPFIPIGGIYRPNRRNSSFGRSVIFVLVFTGVFWLSYSSFLALGSGQKISPILACFAIPLGCVLYLLIFFLKRRRIS